MQHYAPNSAEESIVSACISGDRKAQRKLYDTYSRKMYVVSLRYSKTTAEAEDILQEAFLKIFDAIGDFKYECPLDYWIKRIVINTALKHNRRKMDQMPFEEVSDLNYTPNLHDGDVSNHNFKDLLAMIQRLAPGCQVVFNLHAIEGFKHKEIAEMLSITEGTSKSQYARAKMLLQEMLAKEVNYEKR
ncbi:MAG: RNA polymerase sigma factor [Cytophagales bacterium]|nr:MAG: RNA polymerase sigma factor [Cytophagales bacterium]TAF59795.1 MAG: RNA polymerase sigma factor [Cytophagales bacterium]